ncbi:MAG: hypothetical protein RBS37_12680 [Bacteroidales bacterium]|jgi:hypothetical protein|nr:hypothetical protein [Bacteroidales bacterium]
MKPVIKKVIILAAAMVSSLTLAAQTGATEPDSVAFVSAKLAFDRFTFLNGGLREIKVKDRGIKLARDKARAITRDAGNELLTIITGIGFDSSDEANLKVAGTVICNDGLPDWEIVLFCEGTQEKTRERIRDNDGSISVNTETLNTCYWGKDAVGMLTEGNDTISFFRIVMNPREDSLLKPMAGYFFLPPGVQQTAKTDNMAYFVSSLTTINDHGIQGVFRGQPFSIISDGRQNKSWIFCNDKYACMLFSGNLMHNKSKGVPDPYLIINDIESGPARHDMFRLAMVCRFLDYSLR